MPVSEDCKAVNDWLREPDYAERFSAKDWTRWTNSRPVDAMARLTAALSDQVVGWQEFSGLTPIDRPLLLWFVGRNAPAAAHSCAIGSISSHQPGMVWTDGDYRPVEWFSHWKPLDAGPATPPQPTEDYGPDTLGEKP